MWGQPNTSADAPGASSGLGTSVMGSMPAVITVADIARPPVPSVINVYDRAVYMDNVDAPPPGYVLARRWMRNDPDMDVESLPHPTNTLVLPAPAPQTASTPDDAPVFPDDSEDYDPEEAVRALKRHWVNVRKYDTAQRLQNLDRFKDRMKALTTSGVTPVNAAAVQQLLVQQQQQQQQLQQLHQQQQLLPPLQPPLMTAIAAAQLPTISLQQPQHQAPIAVVSSGGPEVLAGVQQQQQLLTGHVLPSTDGNVKSEQPQQHIQVAAPPQQQQQQLDQPAVEPSEVQQHDSSISDAARQE